MITTQKSYSDKLKDPKWQRKRLVIYGRDNFTCQLCNDDKTELAAHHKLYINGLDPWEYEDDLIVTVCKDCHNYLYKKGFDQYPFRIIKKRLIDGPLVLIVIDKFGLTITPTIGFTLISLTHDTLKDLMQEVMNYWLMYDMQEFLTDKNISHAK